jgi:predicted  nucleic acid-binding Zn-ribbon protein
MRTREALRAAEAELTGAREGLVQANKNLEDVRQGRRTSSDR